MQLLRTLRKCVPLKLRWWRFSQNVLYGLGHVYNDLCAAMWFSYMMLFFQAVLDMRAAVAGTMLLLGQVVDALATPVVGLFADRFGTKKAWHLIGCILVTATFPLLFVRCWGCWLTADPDYLLWWMPLYYAILIVFFQIGWAIVQISHLAMIPSISDNLQVRSELTSIRYMASVMSSLTVYLITWVVLRATNYSTFIGPTDDYKFRDVSLIISGIGVVTFTIFHIFFKLRSPNDNKLNGLPAAVNSTASLHTNEEGESLKVVAKSKIMYFLRMPLLYQTSLLYVFSRLYWALSLVYVPLFLEERLSVNPSAGSELVASVPLVLYISSFFFSLLLKSKIHNCGHQMAYLIGSFMSLVSSLWIALAIDPHANIVQIYLVATLIGAGSSITLVSSLCVTADMIGPHSHQGAAIYSIVTFADKLVTGIAVVAIENYKCEVESDCPQYYRGVLTYACGGSAVLGILSLSITKLTYKSKPRTQIM
ncbi:major facilitator superfamily domain-containing protein 12 isoform X2 [Manduca sexta]|uniref:major facilitator superfamily domain-containing protein 12 isoform X2 n=1 Tax=Manduca sexta TaxID=7130 RepID=UPI001183ADC4|nr:major facilitator superfamily domain-containing protein 12 isoform X2 [Manduca sexta]XP_030036325.1 major facilitator superfamily domain-containing protein 12 isoform X2 [Manduca sexta]